MIGRPLADSSEEPLPPAPIKTVLSGNELDENALRRSAESFYGLIARNPFGVYLINSRFKLVEISLGAQKVFENVRPLHGRDLAEVLRFIWPDPIASQAIERFRHTLATGEPYQAPSFREHRADVNVEEAYDWRIERVTLPDGTYGAVCYFYDLSERQRWETALAESRDALASANDQLEANVAARTAELRVANVLLKDEIAQRELTMAALAQAQRLEALGQLTSGIAHDFNNIVAAIAGGFAVIERRTADPRILEIARHGVKAAERGAGMVKQLLAFAQHQVLVPKIVNICDVLAEVRPLLQRAVEPDLDLAIECAEEIGFVCIDQVMLEAALINLAINARDAMPGGGVLRIEARRTRPGEHDWPTGLSSQEAIAITVADEGSGISAAILERVMEPFFTTKGPGKGTGLGLAMVHGFSKQSGGLFRIESTVGKGTAATIYLPRVSDDDELTKEAHRLSATTPLAAGDLADATLLVVDDDDDVRAVVCAQLEDLGYKTIAASSGAAALVMIAERSTIDAVLSDVVMPGMDGVALAVILRRIRPDLPILFMTGHADRAKLLGESILDKPFTVEELVSGVRTLLARSVGQRASRDEATGSSIEPARSDIPPADQSPSAR